MNIRVSDYIAKKVVEEGITRSFSVTGGGAMFLNDSLGHQEGLQTLYQHHEQACAIAAEGYARIAGKPGLVCVTTGPGGTNAITGVMGAWVDSIPMLILSGQVRKDVMARFSGTGIRAFGDQEFDIIRSISCMTKYAELVTNPYRIRYVLEKAIYLCKTGRPGPVWLDLPLDIQSAFVEEDDLIGFDAQNYEKGGDGWSSLSEYRLEEDADSTARESKRADIEDLDWDLIIDKIAKAKRPVLNAGNGIRIADAHSEFMDLVEALGIPVCVGWNSQDTLYDNHPLYASRPGNFGDRPGNFAIQNSDLVLSIGSRLSLRQVGFNYKTWAREAFTIVNDIDIEELKKPSVHIDIPVHMDCKIFMRELLQRLAGRSLPLWSKGEGLAGQTWLETIMHWRSKYPVIRKEFLAMDDDKKTNVYAFIHELGKRTKENQIIVVGNGSACVVGGHGLIIKQGQRFISNSGAASMGYDLPAAIGAYVANLESGQYEQELVVITGDGSIQMNLQELQTIIHHKMNIKIFVINNSGYHSIRQTQNKFFSDKKPVGIGEESMDLSFPQMWKLAYAYGYPYVVAGTNSELEEVVARAMEIEDFAICEILVDSVQNFEPKSSGKQLADGTMVSPPLEDLAPFLSDEELKENMIIPLWRE